MSITCVCASPDQLFEAVASNSDGVISRHAEPVPVQVAERGVLSAQRVTQVEVIVQHISHRRLPRHTAKYAQSRRAA